MGHMANVPCHPAAFQHGGWRGHDSPAIAKQFYHFAKLNATEGQQICVSRIDFSSCIVKYELQIGVRYEMLQLLGVTEGKDDVVVDHWMKVVTSKTKQKKQIQNNWRRETGK